MRVDVRQSPKFPDIVYESTSVKLNPLRASGEFSIWQSDYGIKPVSAAGGTLKVPGVLKLKDEIKFSCDIVARKQEATE